MEFLKGQKFVAAVTANLASSPDGVVSITDVMEMVPVPKGLLVTDVRLRIDASTTVGGTVSIGDASDADGYNNAVALKVANKTMYTWDDRATSVCLDAYNVGRIYTSAGETIDLKFKTSNVSAGTITLMVEGVVLEQYA